MAVDLSKKDRHFPGNYPWKNSEDAILVMCRCQPSAEMSLRKKDLSQGLLVYGPHPFPDHGFNLGHWHCRLQRLFGTETDAIKTVETCLGNCGKGIQSDCSRRTALYADTTSCAGFLIYILGDLRPRFCQSFLELSRQLLGLIIEISKGDLPRVGFGKFCHHALCQYLYLS